MLLAKIQDWKVDIINRDRYVRDIALLYINIISSLNVSISFQSKSHFDKDTSLKGLSVLNHSIFCRPSSLYKVSSYNFTKFFSSLNVCSVSTPADTLQQCERLDLFRFVVGLPKVVSKSKFPRLLSKMLISPQMLAYTESLKRNFSNYCIKNVQQFDVILSESRSSFDVS